MKHIASLITGLVYVAANVGISVLVYEEKLNIVPRLEDGSIAVQVERSQNKPENTDPNYALKLASFQRRFDTNMTALRRHADEVKCANGDTAKCPVKYNY